LLFSTNVTRGKISIGGFMKVYIKGIARYFNEKN